MPDDEPIRLGTRGSQLARWQADWVARQLIAAGHAVRPVIIETTGDRRSESISALGIQGVFTKEIQLALERHEIDVAIHSLKDLPTESHPHLKLACVPHRAAPWDVIVSRHRSTLDDLPQGARIGTSSRRRQAQLRAWRPDLMLVEMRGNIGTRLDKLDRGEVDGLVLAEAGLERLGFSDRIGARLEPPLFLPAAGQGALGLEVRADDVRTAQRLAPLHHDDTAAAVTAERAVLAALRAGCLAPVGTWGRITTQGRLALDAVVLSLDGTRQVRARDESAPQDAAELGRAVAQVLIHGGAGELIRDAGRDG